MITNQSRKSSETTSRISINTCGFEATYLSKENMRYNVFVYTFLSCTFLHVTCFLRRVYPIWEPKALTSDVGNPLILTPFIEAGNIETAQKLAEVIGFSELQSYSGYFTVNKEYNSNLFFWFFPAETDPENAPVVLWLQGGPGAPSTFGLFVENGPFSVNADLSLSSREYAWTKVFSMLYIDNPVGTGFSFTDNEDGYARNGTQVGIDMYSALQQFFTMFPNLQKNRFYITGESYAGKFVPEVGYRIHIENPSAQLQINLKGVLIILILSLIGLAIGNGFCDPISMLNYSALLYEIGLVGTNAKDYFETKQQEIVSLINQENWAQGYKILDELIGGDQTSFETYFYNQTHFREYFNYLLPYADDSESYHEELIQTETSRVSLHVGNTTLSNGSLVESYLNDDFLRSVKPLVESLLEEYPVLFYNGQLDIIVAYVHTEEFLQSLDWSGTGDYHGASRVIWRSGDDIAGYRKSAGFLTEAIVRNAGHMVPTDQPQWAFDLISNFVNSTQDLY